MLFRSLAQAIQLLDKHLDGLRERLMTYFEIQDLNLKKPKLVGVTACHDGAGVSTLAGELASALSRSGEGNVLLVDMKMEKGRTQSFHNGTPGCGLEQALGADSKGEAQIEKNLFLAGFEENEQDENAGRPLPARFTHLVPKLKASDYEYIIFDMPTVSPTSPTPRLASYMDVTLLVLESGKTAQKPAARALALMRESRASVTAVLNKYRPQVPARIAQD